MSVPFHKQTDPSKQAGQVVYKITVVDNNYPDGIPYEERVKPPQPIKFELTLNEYIERKTDEPKRITFHEWYAANPPGRFWTNGEFENYLNVVWNAALKQGKL
jgi:hypothetical protein